MIYGEDSLVRFSLMATHEHSQIDRALEALVHARKQIGFGEEFMATVPMAENKI